MDIARYPVVAICCFLATALAEILPKSPDCPSSNWFLDEQNQRCLLVVSAPMTYQAAGAACKVLGTQMASIRSDDNIAIIGETAAVSLGLSSSVRLWSKYHILARRRQFYLGDEGGNVIPGSRFLGALANNRSRHCVVSLLRGDGLVRARTECSEANHFMCEHRLPTAEDAKPTSRGALIAMSMGFGLVSAVVLVGILEVGLRLCRLIRDQALVHDDKVLCIQDDDVFMEIEKEDLSKTMSSCDS